ncbi:DMT family transporter [Deinococcus radiophilus]|uniref:DMT family transporter n=1 Tax=Deinococcus radiophilus TaxID=32062 RepID=A0A3S0KNJ2_9DEIO|nr:DMT family transporter [Deinococcus radiophilus]RTR30818.1 DMT family transporter [Deinococcus radiophilus]UFA49400.1 DMT family transporter [Deinococcus radiophilus]
MTRQDLLIWFTLSFFWGASFILIKLAGESFSPLWVAFLRCAFGAAVLWAVFAWKRPALPTREVFWPLLTVALLNNAVPWTLFAWGELTVSSGIAAILNATTPLFTLLVAWLLKDAHVNSRMTVGVLLGLVGVGLTVSGSLIGGNATALGLAMILAAALSYALANTLAKSRLQGYAPLGIATLQLTLSGLMLLVPALLSGFPAEVTAKALASVAVLGIFGSGLAYLLFYTLLSRTSATQASAITYILPIWGIFWGVLAGERYGLLPLLGVAVILAGLTLMNRTPRHRP